MVSAVPTYAAGASSVTAVENWAESAITVTPQTTATSKVRSGGPPKVSPIRMAHRPESAMAAMAVSGLCAVLIGLTFGGPPLVTLLVAVVWGVTVIADSAQFSTAVTELAPAAYVGTALTTQTCLGFALTMVSIWLIPPLVAWAGWRWAFAMLAVGPALGVAAMARLRAVPEARLMAGGRR